MKRFLVFVLTVCGLFVALPVRAAPPDQPIHCVNIAPAVVLALDSVPEASTPSLQMRVDELAPGPRFNQAVVLALETPRGLIVPRDRPRPPTAYARVIDLRERFRLVHLEDVGKRA